LNLKEHLKKQISMMFLFENEASKMTEFDEIDPIAEEDRRKESTTSLEIAK